MGGGSEGRQFFRAGAGQHLPGGHLRGAVPTGVDLYPVFGPALGDDGGGVGGLPAPGEAEGSVGFALCREGRVEEQPPFTVELRVDWLTAPAHEMLPLGNTCTLPWVSQSNFSGWVYSRASLALMASSSTSTMIPRECSTLFTLPLSKMVMVPAG